MKNLYTIFSYFTLPMIFLKRSFIVALCGLALIYLPSNLEAFDYSTTGSKINILTNGTAETGKTPWAHIQRKVYERSYKCDILGNECSKWYCRFNCTNVNINNFTGSGQWFFHTNKNDAYQEIDINDSTKTADIDSHFVKYVLRGKRGRETQLLSSAEVEVKLIFLDENHRTLYTKSTGSIDRHDGLDNHMNNFELSGKLPPQTRFIRPIINTTSDAAVDNLELNFYYDPVSCTNEKDIYNTITHIPYNILNSAIYVPLKDFSIDPVTGDPVTGNIDQAGDSVQTCILGESMPGKFFTPFPPFFPLPADRDKYMFQVKTTGFLTIKAGLPIGTSATNHTKYDFEVKIKHAGHDGLPPDLFAKRYYPNRWERAKSEHILTNIMLRKDDKVFVKIKGDSYFFRRRLDEYRVIFDFNAVPIAGADDICYEDTIFRGICSPFINLFCTKITPIKRNPQTSKALNPLLTNVNVAKLTRSFMRFVSTCGIKDKNNHTISYSCTDSSRFRFFFSSVFSSGYKFDLPDYDEVEEEYRPYTFNLFSLFNFRHKWFGTYFKKEVFHIGALPRCVPLVGGSSPVGPFDVWDTFRNINDRNISTKIVKKDFNLTIAHLDTAGTGLDTRPIPTGSMTYMLVNAEDGKVVPTTERAFTDAANYTINKAYREVFVGLKICTDYNGSSGEYRLSEGTVCDNNKVDNNVSYSSCFATTESATWHMCTGSDNFSIRPKQFDVIGLTHKGTATDPFLLHSGRQYEFQIRASNQLDAQSLDYNQTGDLVDFNKTILLPNDTPDTGDTLNGDLYASNDVMTFANGLTSDANLTFTDVAKVDINITDREWASVDADDTPQSCSGGVVNGFNISDGYFHLWRKNSSVYTRSLCTNKC